MIDTFQMPMTSPIDGYVEQGFGAVPRVDLGRAACRDQVSDVFFNPTPEDEHRAKQVCHRCEVRWECLAYALGTNQRHGVWGGLSADERRLFVRRVREQMAI